MADLAKLKKDVERKEQARDARKAEVDAAIAKYGQAEHEYGMAKSELEQESVLEAVREQRSKVRS